MDNISVVQDGVLCWDALYMAMKNQVRVFSETLQCRITTKFTDRLLAKWYSPLRYYVNCALLWINMAEI